MNKQVFITYSWDSIEHKNWVKSVADLLISKGINVYLDQYDLGPGESFTLFMENSITKSDKVLVVLTPSYKNKSTERKGGVGYEQQIISGEIMSGINRKKFIPLIKEGKYEEGSDCAIPPHFKGIYTLDFRNSETEKHSFDELIRAIYEEPEFAKPTLGNKPDFNMQTPVKSFIIELDEDFNFVQSEVFLTDFFLQISDLRKANHKYNLTFNIIGISEELKEYTLINSLQNLSDEDITRKLELREYLNERYFLPNGTIFEYLEYSINSIIDFSFLKFKYVLNYQDLFIALSKCLKLFSSKNSWQRNTTKFDILHNEIKWIFSIWIPESEVQNLLTKTPIKDKMFLTILGGLDTFDLSHPTLIEVLIPKQSYQFTIDYFMNRINEEIKEECFRTGNWKIGLG